MRIDELTMRFNDRLIDLPNLYHVIDYSPLTISPDSYVVDAVILMSQQRSDNLPLSSFSSSLDSNRCNQRQTSCILVVEAGHLLGIFTDTDVIRVTASGIDLSQVKMAEVMTQPVITSIQSPSHSQDIFTALSLLHQYQIRHLPILDEQGQLVGIVTETCLLQAFDLVKMVGVVAALQQHLQDPTNDLEQENRHIEAVRCQTYNYLKQWIDAQSAEVMQVNQELQLTLEELQVAEEELRQQNVELAFARETAEFERQRYQDLFEFAPDGYLVTDVYGFIQEANNAAGTLLSVRQNYLVGKPLILFIAEQDRHRFITQLQSLQDVQDWEIYLQPQDRKPFPASIRIATVYNSQRQRVGWRWLVSNISEHKQAEAALRQATDELEQRVAERTAELVVANELLQQEIIERQHAEEALRQSEQLYRQLIESQTDLVIRIDLQQQITFANTAACQTLGWQLDELRGQSLTQFCHPDELRQAKQHLRAIASPPHHLTISEQRIFTVNGFRWYQWNVTAIEDETGKVVEIQGVGRDITDRKQMEIALRTSEEKFRHFAANINAVIWIISPDPYQTLYVSPAYEQIWGRSCQSLCEQPETWIDNVHPEDRDRVRTTVAQQLLNGESATLEYRILRPDGSIRWIWDRSFPIRDEQGKVCCYGGIAEDFTERKQVEESLRESEEKFRHFAANTHALLWIANPETGDNLYANPAYEKIWGRSVQSLRDRPSSWIDTVHPEDRDRVIAKLAQHQRGESSDIEYRILRPDGSIRWIWDRGFVMQDEQGKVYSCGGIAEDITERKQAEESLRQSEERLSLALEAGRVGVWDWNLVSNTAVWSANLRPMYGLPSAPEPPTYEEYLDLVHPEDRESVSQVVADTIKQGTRPPLNYRVIWPDGSIHWLCGTGKVYHNEIGQPTRMIGTTRDITDRKQAEEALKESEERYRSVVTAMQEGILLMEVDGSIVACNASAENILGLAANEIIGRTANDSCWQTIHEDGSPFPGETHPTTITLNTGKPCSHVVMGVHKPNGQLTWIEINSQPLFRDNDPTPYAVVASFSDISERQAAKRERKQAQQKIKEQAALLDIATDAILVRDFQSQILFWNKGAERLYGWQAEEVLGKDAKEILYKETLPKVETAVRTVTESGSWQGELRKVKKSGREIIVESRWTLMRDAAGQPKSILSVDTDITQKKQLEEQFFRAQRLESLGTLAGGIAHDLNNILTPILASAQLLQVRYTQDQERYQHLLAIVENNARRGAALVKQVLSFARGFKGERTIVQIKHLISEITLIAKQTFPKSIEFAIAVPEDLWAIFGDVTQLHQVLMNLVVNARDAMPDGGTIKISTENMFIDEAYARMNLDAKVGHYVVMTVADTGIGMPPEILDRIFEPFFTTKEVGTGTGLGLSTMLGIVKSHDGFVNVSSQVGKGSQFKLFLPAVQATQAMNIEEMESPTGDGELILVVDDEAQILEITTIILENYNYKTLTASNGIEAIALYAQHKHHISAVLMDMMMPEMDGTTAIRTLQKMNPKVQIIACSGLNSNEAFVEDDCTNVELMLLKPFTAQELLHGLHHVLKNPEY
ncbi:PAS domain S-box protein [Dendronalium sp. ChiSLP03b]|uniref:PAS domain S-box protein n=1 Tax=Dendronalium sp. ChiSLP03b TaxID=3075381 RepID=UPI003918B01B